MFPGAAPDAPGGARWLLAAAAGGAAPGYAGSGLWPAAAELLGGFAESKVFCRPGLGQVLGGRPGMRVYRWSWARAGAMTSSANTKCQHALEMGSRPGWPHF